MQRIFVPTINDTPSDYFELFSIWQQICSSQAGVVFDFANCNFLRPNAVAFLGGATRSAQRAGISVAFDWKTVRSHVMVNLCQNGFAYAFGHGQTPWSGHSIPYREDSVAAPNPIADYLTDQWLGQGWINISEALRDAIVGRVWEIYANSFEHAQSPVGVFSCGQHFKVANELILTVVDFGTGIPSKVREYLNSLQIDPRTLGIPSSALMRWAFKPGNTTTRSTVPRGLGLDFLKQFVRLNKGSLEVYSEDCHAVIDGNGENYTDLPVKFAGTTVQIKLICDARFYRLSSEPSKNG
ncbi:hypothetical protein [Paraburkholderia sacchari]|uniref:hypothetical protein n=1 Tax=Paraburkholderia sacchari TaxID=159450 RepID=UPI001BCBB574|nr:hypothetical protein [Paraburkholderia sacchari]